MALRLRFSLGTLVLSVLLLAASGAFFWNWHEWVPVRSHTYDRRIDRVDYSPTGKYYYIESSVQYSLGTNPSGGGKHYVVIHDAANGKVVGATEAEVTGIYTRAFWANDRYFSVAINPVGLPGATGGSTGIDFQRVALVHLIDLQSGADLVEQNSELLNFDARGLSIAGSRVLAMDTRGVTFLASSSVRVPLPGYFVADFPTFTNRTPLKVPGTASSLESVSEYFLVQDRDSLICIGADGAIVRTFAPLTEDSVRRNSTINLCRHGYVRNGRLFACGTDGLTICNLRGAASDEHIILDIMSSHMSEDGTRLVYLDQARNMHWYNLESGENKILGASQGNMLPWLTGDSASTFFKEDRVWDVRTGKMIFDLANFKTTQRWSWIHESLIAYADDADRKRIKIFDYKQGTSVGEISRWRCFRELQNGNYDSAFVGDRKFNAAFSKDGRQLAFITENSDSGARYSVFRLNMPDRWRGIPTMPEFWMVVIVLAALMWNVWRNQRAAARKPAI